MASEQTTEQAPMPTNAPARKRKRLTLEEQIARQEELLAKEKESLAKKQQRLRSLNASKMNKDRNEARKKRNSMLIQLGLFFIEEINAMRQEDGFEFIDVKDDTIYFAINKIENKIIELEKFYKEKYADCNTKEANFAKKLIIDKKIMLEALETLKENYLKCGFAKL